MKQNAGICPNGLRIHHAQHSQNPQEKATEGQRHISCLLGRQKRRSCRFPGDTVSALLQHRTLNITVHPLLAVSHPFQADKLVQQVLLVFFFILFFVCVCVYLFCIFVCFLFCFILFYFPFQWVIKLIPRKDSHEILSELLLQI